MKKSPENRAKLSQHICKAKDNLFFSFALEQMNFYALIFFFSFKRVGNVGKFGMRWSDETLITAKKLKQ
jgi:hypothetical protein